MTVRTMLPCLAALALAAGCGPSRTDKVTPPAPEPAGAAACPLDPKAKAEQVAAIKYALSAATYVRVKAEDDATFFTNNFAENRKVARTAASLKAVDTTKCPDDFRQAFFDHVQALEQLDLALRGGPVSTGDSRKLVLETWQKAEKIAFAHGVPMHDL